MKSLSKNLLKISLLLILAIGVFSVTSKVNAIYEVEEGKTIEIEFLERDSDVSVSVITGKEFISAVLCKSANKITINGKKVGDGRVVLTIPFKGGDKTIGVYDIKVISSPKKLSSVDVTSVTLDNTEVTLKVGETITLNATVNPSNATNKFLNWDLTPAYIVSAGNIGRSSEPRLALTLTAVKKGSVTVTVMSQDNNKAIATCIINVIEEETGGGDGGNSGNNNNPPATSTKHYNSKDTVAREIGNEKLAVGDKIKLTANGWNVYDSKELKDSTKKVALKKNGEYIVSKIDCNAVLVKTTADKSIGWVWWNNTKTGAKGNFEIVKVADKPAEDDENSGGESTSGSSSIFKNLLSSLVKNLLPEAANATKSLAETLMSAIGGETSSSGIDGIMDIATKAITKGFEITTGLISKLINK